MRESEEWFLYDPTSGNILGEYKTEAEALADCEWLNDLNPDKPPVEVLRFDPVDAA